MSFGRDGFAPEIRCKFIKSNGEQCKRAVLSGQDFCSSHEGGRGRKPPAVTGIQVNTFKHGRYSKYIPKRMLERFNDNLEDENLIELRNEMALIDARVEELLEALEHPFEPDDDGRFQSGERNTMSNKGWDLVRKAWLKYERAIESGVKKRQDDARNELRSLILEGREEFNIWNDIAALVELRRKLSETEHKRQEALQHYIAVDKVLLLLSATIGSIKIALDRYVTDEDARKHVIYEAEATYQKYISLGDTEG